MKPKNIIEKHFGFDFKISVCAFIPTKPYDYFIFESTGSKYQRERIKVYKLLVKKSLIFSIFNETQHCWE